MLHRLALALGRTLGELDATISPDEVRAWSLYYTLEPWGYEIENLRAAFAPYYASVVAHAPKRSPHRITDFMRKSPVRPRMASAEDLRAAFAPLLYPAGGKPK